MQEKPDSYDKLVSEMALDMRARPSDRIKSAEEVAQEEKERLEELEVSFIAELLLLSVNSDAFRSIIQYINCTCLMVFDE